MIVDLKAYYNHQYMYTQSVTGNDSNNLCFKDKYIQKVLSVHSFQLTNHGKIWTQNTVLYQNIKV